MTETELAASPLLAPLFATAEMRALHADRAVIIGESALRRTLVTVFAERSASETRIISARRATRHERRRHEEGEEA